MQGYFNLYTAPAVEPLTIAELKQHLHLDLTEGEPTPGAPTIALAGSTAGQLSAGAYRYRLTHITADGETDGGTISAAVTTGSTTSNRINLTAIPTGGSLVTQRKLYRTAAGGATYSFLATIGNNTASTYTDNAADSTLGAGCPTTNTTADPELTAILKTSREWIERYCNRSLINATFDYYLDEFPEDNSPIVIPKGKLQSVTSLVYVDEDGVNSTWAAANYNVLSKDRQFGIIEPAYDVTYPDTRTQKNAVTIRCVIGYGSAAANVPYQVKQAVKILCSELYENREASKQQEMKLVPYGVDALLTFEEIPAG